MKVWNGTAWVDTSVSVADDEVWVGPDQPTNTYELWADTDEPDVMMLPTGGTTGQVLAKKSGTDFDVQWANMPRGQIARAVGSTSDRIIPAGTTEGISGMSVTWVADPSRRYKTTISLCVASNSASGVGTVQIATANPQVVIVGGGYASFGPFVSGVYLSVSLCVSESGLSGSQTRQAAIASGAGQTLMYVGTFSRQGVILVEDIGAV